MTNRILFLISFISIYTILFNYGYCTNRKVKKAIQYRLPKKMSYVNKITDNLAKLIEKYFEFDVMEMEKLKNDLDSLNMNISPQKFKAQAIAGGVICGILMLPLTLISPLFIGIILYTFYYIYSKEMKDIRKQIEEKRTKIELELPQFAGTVRQALNSTRNIETILKSYSKTCSLIFKDEIARTLNDIKLSNVETGLRQLSNRIGSEKFSKIIRGLISVSNGEDQRIYFEILTQEYIKLGNELIKKELQKRPNKIKSYSMLLLLCLIVLCMLPMVLYIMDVNMI